MRRLTVNADDFGFTRDVNAGIVEAHLRGILTSTTLMANGAAFEDAVRLAQEHPSLDIGVHAVLVGGPGQPASVADLAPLVLRKKIDVYGEIRAQVERILAAGLRPTHLDTHKHTHLLPPVLEALARIGSEYNIRWIRRPFDLPLTPGHIPLARRVLARGLGFTRRYFDRTLARYGCRATDHFAGFAMTGHHGPADLAALLRALPEGWTEFMTHPGFHGAELAAARTRLKESRAQELAALCAPEVRAAVTESGIELTGYSVSA